MEAKHEEFVAVDILPTDDETQHDEPFLEEKGKKAKKKKNKDAAAAIVAGNGVERGAENGSNSSAKKEKKKRAKDVSEEDQITPAPRPAAAAKPISDNNNNNNNYESINQVVNGESTAQVVVHPDANVKNSMANERTYHKYLWFGFRLGAIGTFLLYFYATKYILWLVILVWTVSLFFAAYGLHMFYKRRRAMLEGIRDKALWDTPHAVVAICIVFTAVISLILFMVLTHQPQSYKY